MQQQCLAACSRSPRPSCRAHARRRWLRRWYGQWLLPSKMDLSQARYMPSVLSQGRLGSCTAHAATNAYRFALVKEARMPTAFMPR